MQDKDGQIPETHSISAGLDYPGVGPEHSWLKDSGRADYAAVTDVQALEALQILARTEGLISALEPSHAVYHAMQVRLRFLSVVFGGFWVGFGLYFRFLFFNCFPL